MGEERAPQNERKKGTRVAGNSWGLGKEQSVRDGFREGEEAQLQEQGSKGDLTLFFCLPPLLRDLFSL